MLDDVLCDNAIGFGDIFDSGFGVRIIEADKVEAVALEQRLNPTGRKVGSSIIPVDTEGRAATEVSSACKSRDTALMWSPLERRRGQNEKDQYLLPDRCRQSDNAQCTTLRRTGTATW
jgi:hypothetical protein